MELLQLKYFLTVAHTEHVSQAAERLFISQSSLSKSIHRLESELGYELFDRSPRSIKLNANGRIFLKHVERVFFELEEAQLSLKSLNEDNQFLLSITTTDPEYIAEMLDGYMKKNSDVLFKNHIFNDVQLDELLELQGVDVAIGEVTQLRATKGWTTLFQDRLYAVCSDRSPLLRNESVSFSDLISRPLSVFPAHTVQRKKMETMYLLNGIMPHIFYEDSSIHKVLFMMLKVDGVSFVTRSGLAQLLGCVRNSPEIGQRLRILRIDAPICEWNVGMCAAKQVSRQPAVQEFVQYAKEYFQPAMAATEAALREDSILL